MYIEFSDKQGLPIGQPRFTCRYISDMLAWRCCMATRVNNQIFTTVDFFVVSKEKPDFHMEDLQKMAFLTLQDLS